MKDSKAFSAGFGSTLVFHQGTLAILHAFAFATRAPSLTAPTWPLHIPAFVSLGWARRYSAEPRCLIVMPLKGAPVAGGRSPEIITSSLLLNTAWGLGVAVFLWVGKLAFHR